MREKFLQYLLELEGRYGDGSCDRCSAKNAHFRCSDCIGDLIHCHQCFMDHHKSLPFHRAQVWNGKYFCKTTLYDEGYVLHLGHQGRTCPVQGPVANNPWIDVESDVPDSEVIDLPENPDGGKPEKVEEDGKPENVPDDGTVTVNIVHTTGVFKHKVRWCQCQSAAKKPVQLFQMRLFSASYSRPETAFTFDVLDHFYIDAMECKTAAARFVKKLCRLTNNAFPHKVPVSAIALHVKIF
jgi:hypothetical protein